jgi:hypothetical protein
MAMLVIYRTDNKPLTKVQYYKVVVVAKQMGLTIGFQLSSAFEAGASSGVAYGVAGALGGASQGQFYNGVNSGAAAGYTGVVYGLGCVVNGMVTASYANIHALKRLSKWPCGWREVHGAKEFEHHVVGAYIRQQQGRKPSQAVTNRRPRRFLAEVSNRRIQKSRAPRGARDSLYEYLASAFCTSRAHFEDEVNWLMTFPTA